MNDFYGRLFHSLPGLACVFDTSSLKLFDSNDNFNERLKITRCSVSKLKLDDIITDPKDLSYLQFVLNNSNDRNFVEMDEMVSGLLDGPQLTVKWNLTKFPKDSKVLLCGKVIEDAAPPVSAPQSPSTVAVDLPMAERPWLFSKADLILILNRMPIGFHSVRSSDGIVLFANNYLLDLLGYEPHEYIGQPVYKFIGDVMTLRTYSAPARKGHFVRDIPYELVAKDGSVRKLMCSCDCNFYPDGAQHYSRAFFRENVEQLVDQALADERVEKIALMAEEKDRFLRVMFHEMKTPLHTLSSTFQGFVKSSGYVANSQPGALSDMRYQIDTCTGLVEDLSFATMFESDQVLHPRPVKMNLRKELDAVLFHIRSFCTSDMTSKAATMSVNVEESVPEFVGVDPSLLRVFNNLIKNAVKYCSINGAVIITLSYDDNSVAEADPVAGTPVVAPLVGTLSVSIKNSVSAAMDLVMVNKMFQSCYSSPSFEANLKKRSPKTVVTSPSTDITATPTAAATTTTTTTTTTSKASTSASTAATAGTRGVTPTAKAGTPLATRPQTYPDVPKKQRNRSITESLTSSEGLGLGLYVSYQIVANLGGLLRCSGDHTQSTFAFAIPVDVVAVRNNSSEPLQLVEKKPFRLWNATELSQRFANGSPCPLDLGVTPGGSTGGSLDTPPVPIVPKIGTASAVGATSGSTTDTTATTVAPSTTAAPTATQAGTSGAEVRTDTPAADATVAHQKHKILVVDDSPLCRKVLVKALESNGYDTDTACDGKEACDKLDVVPCLFDAVLMDLRMPIMDGITATRVCKSKSHLAELPIIIVTAELGEEVRRECMEAKASHFISKPAKTDELLEIIRSHTSTPQS